MTVAELIIELHKVEDKSRNVIYYGGNCYYDVEEVYLDEDGEVVIG